MGHPAIDHRTEELRRLVAAQRALVAAMCDHIADAETTRRWADELTVSAALLRGEGAETFERLGTGGATVAEFFPFDIVLGPYNALAPPIAIEWADPDAVGRFVPAKVHEGPRGCLHGGFIAAGFDQVFNAANIQTGVPGFTKVLSVDYRKPTRLDVPAEYRCRVDRVEGRSVFASGTLSQNGRLTCEATAVFVQAES